MIARAPNATGPFTFYQGNNFDQGDNEAIYSSKTTPVILSLNDQWIAPGHNSVVQDDALQDWMMYHAIGTFVNWFLALFTSVFLKPLDNSSLFCSY